MSGFPDWLRERGARTESALAAFLPAEGQVPARLHEAMRYAALGGGKRVRPLLVHAAGEVTGATDAACDAAACAVEMIHAYSLVHDDMPCMDDDDLRRGRPTVHKAYDEATALLVGDALQTQAFVLLAGAGAVEPATRLRLVAELAQASGSTGMAGGQAIDLQHVGQSMSLEALEGMHRMKTGALLRASVRMGALCGAASEAGDDALAALDRYAAAIGLAFQVVDDILDVTADTATLGKTAGKDAAHDKPTYVSLMGLAGARDLAGKLRAQAHEALAGFGARATRLGDLADLIVLRTN